MKLSKQTSNSYRKHLVFKIVLLIVASLISYVYGIQHLFLLHDLHWDLRYASFFTLFQAYDVEHYLAQMREIDEGNYLLSNTYFAEYKNTQRSPWPLFPLYLCAFTAKVLHLEVWQLAVLMDFFLPPLIFLLAYLFLHTLTVYRLLSLIGAFTLTVLPHLGRVEIVPLILFRLFALDMFSHAFSEAHGIIGGYFSRTINPQLTFILLLACLLYLAKFLFTSRKLYGVLSVFFGILLSYSYVFFSTYLYVCLGMIIFLSLLFREKLILAKTFFILSAILIGSFPFWYRTFQFSHTDLSQMAWMVKDRTPLFFSVPGYHHVVYQIIFSGILGAIIVMASLKTWMSKPTGFVAFAMLVSGIICLNQHVLTGIRVQEDHYMTFIIPQATVLVVFLVFTEMIKTFPWQSFPFTAWCLYGGIFLSIISAIMTPNFVAAHFSPDGILTSEIHSGIKLFHQFGMIFGIFCCILGVGIEKYRNMLKMFYASSGTCYLMGYTGEIFSIVIIGLTLWSVSVDRYEDYRERLKPELWYLQTLNPAFQWLNTHTMPESVVLGSMDSLSTSNMIPIYTHNNVYVAYHAQFYAVPPMNEVVDRVYNMMLFMGLTKQEDVETILKGMILPGSFQEYQEKLHKDVYKELKTYRVDYLFYGPRERQNFKIEPEQHYSFLQKVYDDGIVKIYHIL